MNSSHDIVYRFSGHETFPCRYAWLPKAAKEIAANPMVFSNEDDAMVRLGIGKNMVRAIKFWVEVAGLAESTKSGGLQLTAIGKLFFDADGLDPFLEDSQTLWMLHWNITAQKMNPLFAWEFLFNRWQEPEFSEPEVLKAFDRESQKVSRKLSAVTLKQHFDVFLHTYVPTRGHKGEILEDNLDCPLTELELISVVGERDTGARKREHVYAFRREDKTDITPELFSWFIQSFWANRHPNEKTISAQDIAAGIGSPGQVFKIPEEDVLTRLGELESATEGALQYQDSAVLPQVHRVRDVDEPRLLQSALSREDINV